STGIALVPLYSPAEIHSRGSSLLMDIQKKRQALIKAASLADTRAGRKTRKSSHLRVFPALPMGHRWPTAWPMEPRAFLREPGAVLVPPGASSRLHRNLGPPLSIREVAELIGCSPWTVRQTLIPRGLPHFRFTASGKLIFYLDQV